MHFRWIKIQKPLPSHREWPFLMCTDSFSISFYRVSIPLSRICSLTASMGTSSLWKIPAAKAASTSVFSKTSEKCSTFPAPDEAMTGMETLSLMCFTSSMSKPLLVPSLSMQLSNISPAPSFSQTCVNWMLSHLWLPTAFDGAQYYQTGDFLGWNSYHLAIE